MIEHWFDQFSKTSHASLYLLPCLCAYLVIYHSLLANWFFISWLAYMMLVISFSKPCCMFQNSVSALWKAYSNILLSTRWNIRIFPWNIRIICLGLLKIFEYSSSGASGLKIYSNNLSLWKTELFEYFIQIFEYFGPCFWNIRIFWQNIWIFCSVLLKYSNILSQCSLCVLIGYSNISTCCRKIFEYFY